MMIRKLMVITEEQERFLKKRAESQQLNPNRVSVIVRQIIQSKMDEEKEKEKKEG